MAKQYTRVIHWFRRDLRLTDNTALLAACRASEEVVPAYIVSHWTKKHPWTGPKRQLFLCQCLESLSKNINHLKGALVIREGDALEELTKLVNE
ncbi:MAG TPA: deoxyribodipyrimidine photo-lyase, partial [Verrucomicrobiales bacterium]|nr:deoxyribodipyrimidine photo-lyase [Verrucomicrobiales bacterium]